MLDNLVILKGRLTASPELKTTPNGKSVCSFTVAVNRGYGDNKATDFIDCVAWEQRAEFICRNFNKGSEIRILGEIQTRKYQDKDGKNRTQFEVKANEIGFCGKKAETQIDPLTEFLPKAAEVGSLDDELPF